MKKIIIILMPLFSISGIAQSRGVGINTKNPGAMLEVASKLPNSPVSSDGVLFPVIRQFPIIKPGVQQNAMLVFYDKASNSGNGLEGFYFWNAYDSDWKYIFQTNTASSNLFRMACVANTGFSTINTSDSNTNVWYKTNFNVIDTPDPTFTINSGGDIVIGKTGTYAINFTGGITRYASSVNSVQTEIGVFLGSSSSPMLSAASPIPAPDNAARSVNITISGIVNLTAGNILSVKTRRTTVADTEMIPSSDYSIMLSNLN